MKRRRKSRRNRPLEAASELIYRALRNAGLTEQAFRLKIFQSWNEAVGPEIAARTQPESFRRGILLVKTASSAWQNELMFLKSDILLKLNRLLGRTLVTDLKVVSGHIVPLEPLPGPLPQIIPTPEDYEVAQSTSLPIANDEVRAAFERLMAKDRRARRMH
jgi:predicted nucleic acid-binding Zn ribbon protein